AKRAGGKPNDELIKRAYEFIRKHEKDGIFYPPPLAGASGTNGFKTYMDLLPYADDDAPASNQGFRGGAWLAAGEWGLPVTEEDVKLVIVGYRRMYNPAGQFMPT